MTRPDAPLTTAERAVAASPAETYVPVVPMPEPYTLPAKTLNGAKLPHPDLITEYRQPDGGLVFVVARWNRSATIAEKHIAPLTYDGTRYRWKGAPAPRPLLNAPLLAAHPNAPVLLVEGEKTATVAPKYVPDGWIVSTWHGGAQAFTKTDISILRGHRVVIWPDNDEPGWTAAPKQLQALHALSVPAAVIRRMSALPDKWDLADPLPEGVTPESVTYVLTSTLQRAYVPTPEPEEPPAPPDIGTTTEEFQAVGYNDQMYYFIAKTSQQVHAFSARSLMREDALIEMVPRHSWWGAKFPECASPSSGGIQWKHIGAQLLEQCYAAGVYSEDRIRGRGAWLDEKRIVLHTGDYLIVDGQRVEPAQIKSRFIYPRSSRFTDLTDIMPLTPELSRDLRMLCNLLQWESPIYGDMLCGGIATAVVCGALNWRSHLWLTGTHGAGKSWAVDNIVGKCLGDVAIYPVGITSEAGIRQTLGRDGRPVVFDEAEGRGMAGVQRREAIIELMRQAAHEGRGRIIKGSAGHDPMQFAIRSQFILSSIGVGLREGADETRCIVMTLKPQDAYTAEGKRAQEEHFQKIRAAAESLPADMAPRLLSRMTSLIPMLRANAETFASVIATSLGTRRLGDLLGTPLAGCYTLITGAVASRDAIESYLSKYDWSEFTRAKEIREDLAIIRHLCAVKVRVLQTTNTSSERTIGELIAIAADIERDGKIDKIYAGDVLRRHGIKWDPGTAGFYVATQAKAVVDLMAGSDYTQGFQRILARHPEARSSESAIRFAGAVSRAVWLPAHILAGMEKPTEVTPPGWDEPVPVDAGDEYPRD